MTDFGKFLTQGAIAALLSAGALAVTAGAASAYVVCNQTECWHTDHRYHYGTNVQVEYHPNNWFFHNDWDHDTNHKWRGHHEGRGYWQNGAWITF
jgi:hypothetical protein